MTGAVEGAEDAAHASIAALRNALVGKGDVVVGIAASGTTPYVLAAIKYARGRGAMTIAITSNEQMPLAEIADRAEVGSVQRRYCLKVEPLLAAAGNLPR